MNRGVNVRKKAPRSETPLKARGYGEFPLLISRLVDNQEIAVGLITIVKAG